MAWLKMVQVDAFTEQIYGGNPCAVIFDADELTVFQMQTIAQEMNLSETAFVMKSAKADVRARYFTPDQEIPLAGHPTIATVHALWETDRLAPQTECIRLELEAGIISVELESGEQGTPIITMCQPKPRFLRSYDSRQVMPVFGLEETDLLSGFPITTVSTGTPQLMIPVRNLEALRRAEIDFGAYRQLRAAGDFFSPHLFVVQGMTASGHTFARHFGVPPDTVEDPFTGSATGGMAAYLWRHDLLTESTFIAQQGHDMGRPGEALVRRIGPPLAPTGVRVSGRAVTVMNGRLKVPSPESCEP